VTLSRRDRTIAACIATKKLSKVYSKHRPGQNGGRSLEGDIGAYTFTVLVWVVKRVTTDIWSKFQQLYR